jgi:hypothetical protein
MVSGTSSWSGDETILLASFIVISPLDQYRRNVPASGDCTQAYNAKPASLWR